MVPWSKLPADLQKTILTLVVLCGGAATVKCCPPMVCDPPPPPKTATPFKTPIICDPPPPPSRTVTPFRTPIICDPAPPPSRTVTPFKTPMICDPPPPPVTRTQVTPTATPIRRFQTRSVKMTTDSTLQGAGVKGKVVDAQGRPVFDLQVAVQSGSTEISTRTDQKGEFFLRIPNPGTYLFFVNNDKSNAASLLLKQYDLATVEYVESGPSSQAPLPLAEIRSVDIVWNNGLTFAAETPWADARYRWSVSGGTLTMTGAHATWQPPTEPGRYLLQVIADWGSAGLGVDAVVLVVNEDGSITVG